MRPVSASTVDACLAAAEDLYAETGWPPTLREIAARAGVSSSSTAFLACQRLQERGVVEMRTNRGVRPLRVTPPGSGPVRHLKVVGGIEGGS